MKHNWLSEQLDQRSAAVAALAAPAAVAALLAELAALAAKAVPWINTCIWITTGHMSNMDSL